MRKNINTANIEGYVFQHNLEERTVENQDSANFGKSYIRGSIDVATDDDLLNVVSVNYTYVTEQTKAGGTNRSYTALKKLIDTPSTVAEVGKEHATIVRLTPSLALNDFYPQGGDELVSQMRNEGGFVTILSGANQLVDEKARNTFKIDILINGVQQIEGDAERGTKDCVKIHGLAFNFRNEALPVDVYAESEAAMNWFLGLNASGSNPVYTQVWGRIVSTTVKVEKTTESAFGEAAVETVNRTVRRWVVTGASTEGYDFGSEDVATAEEIKKALADREVKLADVKQRAKEYYANKGGTPAAAPKTNAIPNGDFKF